MIVVMRPGATETQIQEVLSRLEAFQLTGELTRGEERTIIGVVGSPIVTGLGVALEALHGVEKTLRDGAQSLTLENFSRMMQQVGAVAQAVGRSIHAVEQFEVLP